MVLIKPHRYPIQLRCKAHRCKPGPCKVQFKARCIATRPTTVAALADVVVDRAVDVADVFSSCGDWCRVYSLGESAVWGGVVVLGGAEEAVDFGVVGLAGEVSGVGLGSAFWGEAEVGEAVGVGALRAVWC